MFGLRGGEDDQPVEGLLPVGGMGVVEGGDLEIERRGAAMLQDDFKNLGSDLWGDLGSVRPDQRGEPCGPKSMEPWKAGSWEPLLAI